MSTILNLQSPHSHNYSISKCTLGTISFWNAIEKGLIPESPDLRFEKAVIIHRVIPILIELELE